MSVDFPRAWQITRSKPIESHNPKCSWAIHRLLCDCDVLMKHPETTDEILQNATPESEAQNFSGFGEICNQCKNQTEEIRGFDIATRCKKAGQLRDLPRNHPRHNFGEKAVVTTDLVKLIDGSEICSDWQLPEGS